MTTLQQEAERISEKLRLLEQQLQERERIMRARADLAIKREIERDLAQIQQRDLGAWEG